MNQNDKDVMMKTLRAYRDLPDGLKPNIFSMLAIADDPSCTPEDKEMAADTIEEALAPTFGKDGQYGVPIEQVRPT